VNGDAPIRGCTEWSGAGKNNSKNICNPLFRSDLRYMDVKWFRGQMLEE